EKALKTDNGKTMKIVMLTTESSDEMKNKGKEAGAVGWLVKPFANESLTKLISQLI
ncbi:response regulator, partial [Leptospira kemamanensis]